MFQPVHKNIIQPKLTIGEPDDQYEREADTVASQVMRMRDGDAPIQRKCAQCETKEVMQARPMNQTRNIIQRRPIDDSPSLASEAREAFREAGSAPITVDAVDDRQEVTAPWYFPPRYAGPLVDFFRGDVNMTNVTDMVDNILTFIGQRQMIRLNIADHGNSTEIQIGDDWVSDQNLSQFQSDLSRLNGHFAPDAIVHIEGCQSGQNQALVCGLASIFGVTVYAGTGYHIGTYRVNTGDYVRCSPSGVFETDVGRP